ncbi:MAG: DUF455 family protein, partial [Sphingobium sp.]
DAVTARMLRRILSDEIRHVAAVTRWFAHKADGAGISVPEQYQILVKRHFKGAVKPPFNHSARRQAGLTRDYYVALAT